MPAGDPEESWGWRAMLARILGAGSSRRHPHGMAWYKREDSEDELGGGTDLGAEKRSVPVGVFTKCPGCRAALLTADLEKTDQVCPHCEHHFPLGVAARLQLVLDEGSFVEEDAT